MKLLITGSKGFIGQNMVEYLKHDIDQYDILDGYKRPKELDIGKYDQVIHLGAISSTTETNVQKIMDLNVSWAIELFEECIEHYVQFQWSSSASVYGNSTTFKVNQPLKPLNLYARSKMLLETYIVSRSAPIPWQGFRYFNVYGNYEDHKGTQASPYHQFSKQAQETGTIRVFEGSEHYKRDFVPVESVCAYHAAFMKRNVSGIFNIGSGSAKSFLQVAKEVASQHESVQINEIPFPRNLKTHYQAYTCADMSVTESVLNI